jgi:hypothetical protein
MLPGAMLPGPMLPGRMVRQCADVERFIINNGAESYQQTFRPMTTVEELLQDENIAKWNEQYDLSRGPGINDNLIAAFIEYWGVYQYKDWCARDSTYDSIISNGLFASAQQKYLEKYIDQASVGEESVGEESVGEVPVGIRGYKLSQNPFRQEFRDHKGVAVPEPPTYPTISHPFADEYELYIQENGIINYMIKVTCKIPLEVLLNHHDVAMWQKSYINKLRDDEHLF